MTRRAEEAFGLFPLYARSAIYKLGRVLAGSDDAMRYDNASFYPERRRLRRAGPVSSLPPLDTSVREYGLRIGRLADECRARDRHCLFMTQPALWRDGLTPAETASLWLGWLGPQGAERGYVSVGELRVAMDRLNAELLRVTQVNGVAAFDLAAAVPRSGTYFYDDCHYTDEGAKAIAAAIAAHLRTAKP